MFAVPADRPLTAPDDEPSVITPAAPELVHVPPPNTSLNEELNPTHTACTPLIGRGNGLTNTLPVAMQPDVVVYVRSAAPAETPVTRPLAGSRVMPELVVLHVPPAGESLNVTDEFTQTCTPAVIAAGSGATVTIAVAIHPLPFVKVIIAVPAATPVTMPLTGSIVATPVLPLVQLPLPDASLNDVLASGQTSIVPSIAEGSGFTVTTAVVIQPMEDVYVIVAVPGLKPVTTPNKALTGAIVMSLLLHVPPVTLSLKLVVASPAHTDKLPLIAVGCEFTDTSTVA